MSRPSKYPEQFRKDAVASVRASDRPPRHVARELGVNHETLRDWVKTTDQATATEVGTQVWAIREDARRAVSAHLGCYNHDRLHSTLDYRTPHEVRVGHCQDHALAA